MLRPKNKSPKKRGDCWPEAIFSKTGERCQGTEKVICIQKQQSKISKIQNKEKSQSHSQSKKDVTFKRVTPRFKADFSIEILKTRKF